MSNRNTFQEPADDNQNDQSAAAPIDDMRHGGPDAKPSSPMGAKRRGAPKENQNATRTHSRGSKMPAGCRHEEGLVSDFIRRVVAEWRVMYGERPMPVAADVLLQQIRRAVERDRVAARLLRTLRDLKGGDLSHSELVEQREIQARALATIERCIISLGLASEPEAVDPQDVEPLPAAELPADVLSLLKANAAHDNDEDQDEDQDQEADDDTDDDEEDNEDD